MRKHIAGIVFIFILALIVPGTIGCGGGNLANTPEETVRAYIQAYESKNTTAMATLQTQEYTESLSGGHTAYWTNRWGSNTFSMSSVKVTITNQNETTAEATATCNMVVKNSQGSIQYQGGTTWDFSLLKTNGIWEVDSDVSAQQTG